MYPFVMIQKHKRTKIVCTIGPATDTVRAMIALGNAGMDVARLNFSHGTHASHAALLRRLRQAGRHLERPFAILQDLQGPKIRVGNLPDQGVLLRGEAVFSTSPNPAPGDIPVTLPSLHADVARGSRILLDDGLLECVVRRVDGHRIHCDVLQGGTLTSHKGLNLPGTHLRIPALSDKDRADAAFGVKAGVDFVAMSFIRTAKDVEDLRRMLKKTPGAAGIQIIGKIEKPEAIDHFDSILPLLDAVMVARGDLGIELRPETVPVIQKQIINACRHAGKPVIVATQMLDSMQRNPRATRAETSDVANAVADHTDAVMLSGETATGAFPVQAVRAMATAILAMERSVFDDLTPYALPADTHVTEIIGATVRVVSDALQHAPVLLLTASGATARAVSAYRPEARLFAVTHNERVARQLRLVWGQDAFFLKKQSSPEKQLRAALSLLQRKRLVKPSQLLVAVSGSSLRHAEGTNRIEIVRV